MDRKFHKQFNLKKTLKVCFRSCPDIKQTISGNNGKVLKVNDTKIDPQTKAKNSNKLTVEKYVPLLT